MERMLKNIVGKNLLIDFKSDYFYGMIRLDKVSINEFDGDDEIELMSDTGNVISLDKNCTVSEESGSFDIYNKGEYIMGIDII